MVDTAKKDLIENQFNNNKNINDFFIIIINKGQNIDKEGTSKSG